jgi:hypothetical protein
MRYEVELMQFAPTLATHRYMTERHTDVVDRLGMLKDSDLVLVVCAISDDVDQGNFILFLNSQGRARVRLDEHRDHYARQEMAFQKSQPEVFFRYEDGSPFSVPYTDTLPQACAIAALLNWLPSQRQDPTLIWD